MTGPGADDDDDTVISTSTSDDSTVVSERIRQADDSTVVSGHEAVADDGTLLSARRLPGGRSDETVANRPDREQDRTRKVVRAPRRGGRDDRHPAAPGITGARRAVVPDGGVERYSVRVVSPELNPASRSPLVPPVADTRQSADAAAIDAKAVRVRRRQGAAVLVAIALVTLGAVALVAATVMALLAL